ncbi:PREDICTED: zinc finger protein 529 [Chinchilla lanigera]|uniref:zinc finger protein 529 n=1 Tax=Chinchilla lanigera TaxID=34839 RepID=UPI000696E11F|nr:PREDICTED: zinc finger protein 529 [Chinchilla lanigera]
MSARLLLRVLLSRVPRPASEFRLLDRFPLALGQRFLNGQFHCGACPWTSLHCFARVEFPNQLILNSYNHGPYLEMRCETESSFIGKGITDSSGSHLEVMESTRLADLDSSIFRNDWQSKSKIEVHGLEGGCFNQIKIISDKEPNYKHHKCVTLPWRMDASKKPCDYKEYGKVFDCDSDCDEYQRILTDEKTHECNECWKSFGLDNSHTLQLNICTGVKPCKYMKCGDTFIIYEDVNVYQNIHSHGKYYTCKEYGKILRAAEIAPFQIIHDGGRPYKCMFCGKSFRIYAQLIRHHKIHSEDKPYRCMKCDRDFRFYSQRTEHHRIHTGEKPYKCIHCEKVFRIKSQLIEHEQIHTGEKPYICKECGKAFGVSRQLARHQITHTNKKPYECTSCRKVFRNSSSLTRHQRIHTGEKPYKCKECEKAFGLGSELTQHQRIHSGQKPYECKECGRFFRLTSFLIQRQRIHSGEKPYYARYVGKPLDKVQLLGNINELILEKSPMNARHVGRLLDIVHPFQNIREFIGVRSTRM